MIPVVLAVILLVFGLLYITPGSNMDRMAVYTGDAFDGVLEKIEPASGFFARYMRYCYNIFFKFEFGYGGRGSADIGAQMKLRWGWTLRLAGLSLLVSALIGIPAGVISAVTSGGWQDRVISAVATVFSSIPSLYRNRKAAAPRSSRVMRVRRGLRIRLCTEVFSFMRFLLISIQIFRRPSR